MEASNVTNFFGIYTDDNNDYHGSLKTSPSRDIPEKMTEISKLRSSSNARRHEKYPRYPAPPFHHSKESQSSSSVSPINLKIKSIVSVVNKKSQNKSSSCPKYLKIKKRLESLICDMLWQGDKMDDSRRPTTSSPWSTFLIRAGMFTNRNIRDHRSLSYFTRKLSSELNKNEESVWNVLEILENRFLKFRRNPRNSI